MSPSEHLLFVYGTLMSGEPDPARLAGARPLGPAATEAAFDLVDLAVEPALVPGGLREAQRGTCIEPPCHLAAP